MPQPKRICFVTGTRAEFGLMRSTLRAIAARRELRLQLVVTGMHLHEEHGRSVDLIRREGWTVDAVVPWKRLGTKPSDLTRETGAATAGIAAALERLESDVVLVVGDRVEAFAAATAGHLSRRIVAHVHGGDRAEGQIDDSLRHAITKLSHVHFPATKGSAERIRKLGEDAWRIHQVGSSGLDGIAKDAANAVELAQFLRTAAPSSMPQAACPPVSSSETVGWGSSPPSSVRQKNGGDEPHPTNGGAMAPYALVVLHPIDASEHRERDRAAMVLDAVRDAGIEQTVVIYPNNDPGSKGIIRCWTKRRRDITYLLPDAPRGVFLGLMRDCAVMVGNSSAGIIEAGALGTPVVNVGDRQAGRERGGNVTDVPYDAARIARAVRRAVRNGRSTTPDKTHPYGGGRAGERIAAVLAGLAVDERLVRKLIAY